MKEGERLERTCVCVCTCEWEIGKNLKIPKKEELENDEEVLEGGEGGCFYF